MSTIKRKAKIIMLPTEKATNHTLWLTNNNQLIHTHVSGEYLTKYTPQNLYIISDDEIKEGDWYIDDTDAIRQSITSNKEYWGVRKDYKKIIATTDSELKKTIEYRPEAFQHKELPQPSPQFIAKFIESYNKGDIITDILVEYEYFNYNLDELRERHLNNLPHIYQEEKLKVDRNNHITITKVKDSWNKEEVEAHCKHAFKCGMESESLLRRGFKDEALTVDNWINQNL